MGNTNPTQRKPYSAVSLATPLCAANLRSVTADYVLITAVMKSGKHAFLHAGFSQCGTLSQPQLDSVDTRKLLTIVSV